MSSRDRSILAAATSRTTSEVIIADNAQARVSLAVRIVRLRKLDRLRRLSLRNTRSTLTQCDSSLGRTGNAPSF